MWATARYTFNLSNKEFWDMSPGMWIALNEARYSELKVYDMFQARVSSTVASTVPRKSKRRIKEADFRIFKDNNRSSMQSMNMLDKMRAFTSAMGIEVRSA